MALVCATLCVSHYIRYSIFCLCPSTPALVSFFYRPRVLLMLCAPCPTCRVCSSVLLERCRTGCGSHCRLGGTSSGRHAGSLVARAFALALETTAPPASLVSISKPAGRLLDEGPVSPRFEELYAIGPEVGKGCFATCYEVTSRATGRAYCAKKLPKARPRQTAQRCLAAINDEVRILRQLQHCEDVLQICGVIDGPDYVYIITELCRGGTLADHLRNAGPLTESQAAHALRSILSAINACHCAGIEYGDLKPSNVLLRRKPTVPGEALDLCLADFGCSQYVDRSGRASSSPGTPLFAAPEVMFKRNGLEADLWSAGVLLYHMLSSQWPFFKPEENLSPSSVMRRALSAPIHWSNFDCVSSGAVRLIERMLDREKDSRITAKEALQHPWILQHTSPDGTEALNS